MRAKIAQPTAKTVMQVEISCHFCQFCFTMETVIRLLTGLLELLFS